MNRFTFREALMLVVTVGMFASLLCAREGTPSSGFLEMAAAALAAQAR